MKVLNLRCANGHGFEGWFRSDEDYQDQNGRALIECPLCGDRIIARLPTAPRLNLSSARGDPVVAAGPAAAPATGDGTEASATWLAAVRDLLAQTEDVGSRFPEEARRIHYGETPQRAIRGQASESEREALREEGIATVTLALPRALDGKLQ
jgi:hypothetical protein